MPGEVTLAADELARNSGEAVDFRNLDHQNQIIAYTYQRLLRYTETILNYATSLDQQKFNDGSSTFIDSLSRGEQENPLEILTAKSNDTSTPKAQINQLSLGVVWISLLDRCNNRMTKVARFLNISLSQSYRCYNKVLQVTAHQCNLPLQLPDKAYSAPRPWRRSRLYREPVQLSFQFDDELPFGMPQHHLPSSSHELKTRLVRY